MRRASLGLRWPGSTTDLKSCEEDENKGWRDEPTPKCLSRAVGGVLILAVVAELTVRQASASKSRMEYDENGVPSALKKEFAYRLCCNLSGSQKAEWLSIPFESVSSQSGRRCQ